MKMSNDQACHRTIELFQDLRPHGAHCIVRKAGIDNHPTSAVAQQPEVDVIKLKRQRHAQPENAGRDFGQFAGSRRMGVGKMQGHGQTFYM